MSEWKKVKIDFDTIKLGDFIEPIKTTVLELGEKNPIVYGVTNKEGIVQTGKPASKDISNYIALEDDCFAFNPYRVNVGSIGINDKKLKGCVSPAYVVFRTKNGLLPKFLYFYLKSDYGIHLINWYGNRGGVRNALRYSDLCNIDIPNINHLDQQKILKKFLSASDKIDEISKEIESQKNYIKQLRQNILQDAIEGKLTTDWHKQNPVQKGNPDYDAEALFEQIQKERNSEKKQKELSPITDEEKPFEIPEGWKWVRLGSIVENITSGSREWAKYYSDKGAIFLRMGNLSRDSYKLRLEKLQYVCVPETTEGKRTRLVPFDLLFSITAEIGNLGLIPENFPEAYINQHTARIRFVDSIKQSLFFANSLLAPAIRKQYMPNAHGMKNSFRLDTLSYLIVPLPPLAEQKEIVALVEKHLHTVSVLENQIAEREEMTKQLMQSILKDAFEEI